MNITNASLNNQDTVSSQSIAESESSKTKLAQESQPKQHILILDGVRAIACLSVLLFHLNLVAAENGIVQPVHNIHDIFGILIYFVASLGYAGDSGVILFFLLSGFLLFLPYAKAMLFDNRWPSFHRFYLRRFFRILPGYYVVLFLMILFFHSEFLHPGYRHDLWLFLTFRMSPDLSSKLNGVFWTLAVEFQFYLLLPILAWFFSLIVRRGTVHRRLLKLTLCLLLMTAWGLLRRFWTLAIYIPKIPKLDFLISHPISIVITSDHNQYFDVFAVGMTICMIYTYIQYASSAKPWHIRMASLSPVMLAAGLILLLLLSLWYFYYQDISLYSFATHPLPHTIFTFLDPDIPTLAYPYWQEWQALGYAIGYGLCLLALLYGSARIKHPFESSLASWIASISFSLYMWHLQFMHLFGNAIVTNLQRQGWNPIIEYFTLWCWTLIIIIPSAALLYRWIEQPGIRLGEQFMRKLERLKKNQGQKAQYSFTILSLLRSR